MPAKAGQTALSGSQIKPPALPEVHDLVGRENMIAGTDCGLGGRIHRQIVWAKLKALSEGARLATRQLWGRA